MDNRIEKLRELREFGQTLIGKNYDKVSSLLKKEQIQFRVKTYNGNACMLTCDMKIDRLNFTVENDLITKVTFG